MTTGKVFLCHSSADKPYVDHVAHKLGRTRVAYDKLSFQVGQDFKREIERCLGESGLFVFFASDASLKSYWCKFELSAAEKLRIKGALDGAMAIITDRTVDFSDLPRWMSDLRATRLPAPSAAVREIEAALFAMAPPDHKKSYVVRPSLQDRLQQAVSAMGDNRPRMIVLAGLEGIGRRSFLDFASQNVFGTRFGPVIRIDDTVGLEDVYLTLLDETTAPLAVSSLATELQAFRDLHREQACDEVANRVQILCELNHFPCFVDNGGLLDENGIYKPAFEQLFQQCLRRPMVYFGVTHRRRPNLLDGPFDQQAFFQSVGPLSNAESVVLLGQLLRRLGATVATSELNVIIDSLGGYPPAIQVAANYIAEYGLDVLRRQSFMLVDFTAKRFLPFLRELQLAENESAIMQYLACERPMTLDTIAIALGLSHEATAPALRRLIDLNIVVNEDNRHTVSEPLRDSITRLKGLLSSKAYEDICKRLTAAWWSDENDAAPPVDAIDATLHAALIARPASSAPYLALIRASTVHRLAKEAYHQKNYSRAEAYALRAIQMDDSRWQVLVILIKALIQQEKYGETEVHLQRVGDISKKSECYLRGFMAKKRYQTRKAIEFFEQAIQHGDDSISIHRDLAESLYRDGRLKDAVDRIEKARSRMRDNPYVLDLAIKIYVDNDNPAEASSCLRELEVCDLHENFIHHCKARLLAAQGDYRSALDAAKRASLMPSPPFEVFAKKIDILMHLGDFQQAWADLDELERKFPRQRRDILRGLRCKWHAMQGNWSKAQIAWDELAEKDRNVAQGLLRMLLEVKSKDMTLSLVERQSALTRAQAINVRTDRVDASLEVNSDDVEY